MNTFRSHSWLIIGLLALNIGLSDLSGKQKTDEPNVLFLFTDDQRHDTIQALGNPAIQTPNLDRLVREGVTFRNAYIMGGSSPAVCSPSRASLFTGRTLWRLENQGIWGFEISEKYKTLPQVFRENGYITFATGKNEPGRSGHFARSFNAGDKILFRGMTRSQYRLPLFPYSPEGDYSNKRQVLHEGVHSSEVYADACIEFLEQQADSEKPFFAYVSFQTPHDPRQSPDAFRSLYKDEEMKLPASFMPRHPFDNGMLKIRDEMLAPFPRTETAVRKHIADYYAIISHTDAEVGRILEALEKSGKKNETIIVFSSDNGLAVGRHGLMGKQNIY
ncbi:MAG: sulfatase-like hydrolase/transferase, partial [Verrucomicrobiota bacterium]